MSLKPYEFKMDTYMFSDFDRIDHWLCSTSRSTVFSEFNRCLQLARLRRLDPTRNCDRYSTYNFIPPRV